MVEDKEGNGITEAIEILVDADRRSSVVVLEFFIYKTLC